MKLFLKKIIYFIIIVTLLLAYPVYVLVKSGELNNPDYNIAKQDKNKGLFGLAYADPSGYYKVKEVKEKKPEVLVLGSSRSMYFRNVFFKDPNVFYNAGRGTQSAGGLNEFVQKTQADPKVLIICIDQFWFNDAAIKSAFPIQMNNDYSLTSSFLSAFEHVCADLMRRKIKFATVKNAKENIGLAAIMFHEGFRIDGSFQDRRLFTKAPEDSLSAFRDNLKRIDEGTKHYEHGSVLSANTLNKLNSFLDSCKKKNIHVVAYLPPYAPCVWDKIELNKDKYQYMFKINPAVKSLFSKYPLFSFYDFSDYKKIGGKNVECFDGLHTSEKANLRMLIAMCKTDTVLNKYCDLDKLNNMLTNSYSDKSVIKNILVN